MPSHQDRVRENNMQNENKPSNYDHVREEADMIANRAESNYNKGGASLSSNRSETQPTNVNTSHRYAELIGKSVRDVYRLEAQKQGMIKYLILKVDEGDWHGVADAAMDIREKEAALLVLKSLY